MKFSKMLAAPVFMGILGLGLVFSPEKTTAVDVESLTMVNEVAPKVADNSGPSDVESFHRYGRYGRYGRYDRYGRFGRFGRYGRYGRGEHGGRWGRFGRGERGGRWDRHGRGRGHHVLNVKAGNLPAPQMAML